MTIVNDWLFVLTIIAALGCGLIAGVFFAFSAFVMKALRHLPSSAGIAAMQSINLAVINPWFMLVFLGTAFISVILSILAILQWQAPDAIFLLIGGLLYLVGSFLVTLVFNVPKNNALAAITPADPASSSLWAGYLTKWTAWNHFRMLAALAATISLILALCY